MPEVSNCELYKLESKLEEITLVIKRAQEQLERIKNGSTNFLDDDQLSAVQQMLLKVP